MKRTLVILMLGVSVVSTAVPGNLDRLHPDGQAAYRQSAMLFMRWNMARIKRQIHAEAGRFRQDRVSAASKAIAAVANSGFDALFNEATVLGHNAGKTRLEPSFFEQRETAERLLIAFIVEANTLARVADDGDRASIKRQFDKLHRTCRNCHDRFRAK